MEDEKESSMVYVCSPYLPYGKTHEDRVKSAEVCLNLEARVGRKLSEFGYVPILPQLYLSCIGTALERVGMELDYTDAAQFMLLEADELWIIGDIFTDEMMRDVELAKANNIRIRYMVFTDVFELLEIPVGDISKWKIVDK